MIELLSPLASLAMRNWKLILAGGMALFLTVALFLARSDASAAHEALKAEKASHALDKAAWETASAKAIAHNLTYVRSKEDDAATITETTQHDLEKQLADARALAARYAGSVRACPANPGSAGKAGISEAPGSASDPVTAGRMSIVDEDDLRICSDAVVKARGWPAWYASIRSTYNAEMP